MTLLAAAQHQQLLSVEEAEALISICDRDNDNTIRYLLLKTDCTMWMH
jgi:hypothetical protein